MLRVSYSRHPGSRSDRILQAGAARESFAWISPERLIQKSLLRLLEGRSDANFDFADRCLILERAGFTLRQGKGSHRIYFREGVEEILNLQPRGAQAKPYQVKQVRDLIHKHQPEID